MGTQGSPAEEREFLVPQFVEERRKVFLPIVSQQAKW